ncbi:hypothetical protein ACFQ0R_01005 [Psychroflexus salinarum]|uniref:DUF3575 domain-containing protein n=1 Tax=Psychroflexus salinarum TaxID=546024 RepID=A0ABW3GLA4_9FLAO
MANRKIYLTLGLFLLFSLSAKAQQFAESWDGVPNIERHQFTLNFIGPGIRYELGLFKNVSVSTSISPGLALYQEGYSFGFAWHTRVRYYHNFKTRYNFNKEIAGNSANYIAPARTVFWDPLQISHNLDGDKNFSLAFYGAVYGFQRTNEKGFNTTFELGFGYYDGFGVPSGYGPLLNFTFGWVATKKKSNKIIKVN